ncbi:hypothetical protein GBA65_00080 [Rubrobacter marinus]|uniref:Nudix hydrolase N-terminal domain-containing protein n=1 Tax=Rubrobacter marinus TaxID=2653852 RepID=A0A6G8PSW5_9ACTN|nr:hypothetical protein GBA65_00080 [Rubrobacter marinus]
MGELEYDFCPRCGGRLRSRRVKDGEPERLVCEECSFIFYLGPKLVAAVICEMNGGIVMTQRAIEPGYGKWTFPGGFMDRGRRRRPQPRARRGRRRGRGRGGAHPRALLLRGAGAGDRGVQGTGHGRDSGAVGRDARREGLSARRPALERDGVSEHGAGARGLRAQRLP